MSACMESRPKIIPQTESFTLHLSDKYAANALMAYAMSCKADDPQLSNDVRQLANRAMILHDKRKP